MAWVLFGGPRHEHEDHKRGRPKPDWGRRGTQPKGIAGPPPRPNGKPVATQRGSYKIYSIDHSRDWINDTVGDHLRSLADSTPLPEDKINLAPAYRSLHNQVKLVTMMEQTLQSADEGSPFWHYVSKELKKERARLSTITDEALGEDTSPTTPKMNLIEKVQEKVAGDLLKELEQAESERKELVEEVKLLERRLKKAEWKTVSSINGRGKIRSYKIPPPGPPNPLIRSGNTFGVLSMPWEKDDGDAGSGH